MRTPVLHRTIGGLSEPNQPAGRLLIVDDEYALRRSLHLALYGQGFDVNEASNGDEALALARAVRYDAVLLDFNMPGRGGVTVCRELRSLFPHLAILMLTVRGEQEDRVEALDAGADDYIVKPFHMGELMARIRAAVRRVQPPPAENDAVLTIGEIRIYPIRRLVLKADETLKLTPKEFDVLLYLMQNSGVPVSHRRLLTAIWGIESTEQVEYLRTFVRQLRKKLEDDPANPRYILTDSRIGYRFRSPDEEAPDR